MADKNDVWLMQLAESIKTTVKQIETFDGTLTEQQAMGIATSMTTLQKAVERMFHGKVRIGDAK